MLGKKKFAFEYRSGRWCYLEPVANPVAHHPDDSAMLIGDNGARGPLRSRYFVVDKIGTDLLGTTHPQGGKPITRSNASHSEGKINVVHIEKTKTLSRRKGCRQLAGRENRKYETSSYFR